VPEILPLHARAKGTAIGISSNWLWVSSYSSHHVQSFTNNNPELCRSNDHTNPHQQPPMASLPHLHVHKSRLCPSSLFLVSFPTLKPYLYPRPTFISYPETSNLTLEEVDYLFVKGAREGHHKFAGRSQAVRISLKEDVEQGAKEMMHEEKKRGSEGGAAFVEDVDKVEK
jgi:hypothetical protein